MVECIRDDKKCFKGISNCWNCMLKYFHVLSDWLVWKAGNGHNIIVGEDPMAGVACFYRLSLDLLNSFHNQGTYFLA